MRKQSQPSPRGRGFTLVELLIVVAILGIMAAIVIPRFTDASSQARNDSLSSQLQIVRRQIELYRLEHGGTLPDLITDWTPLTTSTTWGMPPRDFGPYLHMTPRNPLNTRDNVEDGDGTAPAGAACGYVYDYDGGSGSGRIFGTGTDGLIILPN